MHVDVAALTAANAARWQNMQVHPDLIAQIDRVVARLWTPETKPRYEAIGKSTGVPAPFIALAHERESSGSWLRSLAQGDVLTRRSVDVPRGRIPPPAEPPFTFEAAAVDALVACDHVNQWTDWGVPGLLTKLELWNGAGYYLHGHPSPYIWASTDQYGPPHALAGKYVRDSEFDPNAIDTQLGCAAMLARLFAQDSDVRSQFGQGLPPVHPAMIAPPAPAQAAADRGTEWQQAALNRLSTIEPYETAMANAMQGTGLSLPLDVDGDYGRSTKQATRGFQRAAGVFDDGKCGPVTSAAIAAALAANPAKT